MNAWKLCNCEKACFGNINTFFNDAFEDPAVVGPTDIDYSEHLCQHMGPTNNIAL